MVFGNLSRDMISIFAKDGKRTDNILASVLAGSIYITTNATKILVEAGNVVFREMSNGGKEYFEVIDPGYYEGISGIPANYQMKVRKLSEADAHQLLLNLSNTNSNDRGTISDAARQSKFAQWEKLGLDRVKSDLTTTGGMRDIGGPPENRELAWEWVKQKEAEANIAKAPTPTSTDDATHIADSRLNELRALKSSEFDFIKLIRMCEEINSAYANDCYFATAMLTRAVLDHVPPLFNVKNFAEVANNYSGGTRSFKEAMLHLENASRKISDGHLHGQIRKKETLPVAQQVNFAPLLDSLLSEIVRIFK